MASETNEPKKQPCNNNCFKNQAQIYWYNINNAKNLFKHPKNRLEVELHDFNFLNNETFICLPASLPACLTTGNNLPPKPLGIQPPFFFRAKSTQTFLVLPKILVLCHCDYFHLQCLGFFFMKVQKNFDGFLVFNMSHRVHYTQ